MIASFARPVGSITGVSVACSGLLEKRQQLLKDIVPSARWFAMVFNPALMPPKALADLMPGRQQTLGVAMSLADVGHPDDFDGTFAALLKERVNGIVFVADPNGLDPSARSSTNCA